MATPAEILTTGGLANADLIVQAATATGIPLAIAAAMIQKETGGKNVYGHDGSAETGPGVFSTKYGPVVIGGTTYAQGSDIPVTQGNFAEFLRRVTAGEKSNGVGPAQLTYAGYFRQAPDYPFWDALANIRFGLTILADYLDDDFSDASISSAGAHYNGGTNPGSKALAYGADLLAQTQIWRARLAGASELGGSMPKVFLSPSDQDNNPVDGGGNEQQYAQERCARAAEVLRAHGVTVKVSEAGIGDDTNGYVASVKEGEAWGPDIYVADHTNATGTANKASGVQAYCWLGDPNSKRLGECINARMDPIVPGGASIQDGSNLHEVSGPSATAVLMESGYHDNPLDASVIRTKTTEMGEALAHGILDYFGIPIQVTTTQEDIMSDPQVIELLTQISRQTLGSSDALTRGQSGIKWDGDAYRHLAIISDALTSGYPANPDAGIEERPPGAIYTLLTSIESKLDALATTTEPERAESEPATPAEPAPVTGANAIRSACAAIRSEQAAHTAYIEGRLSIIESNL